MSELRDLLIHADLSAVDERIRTHASKIRKVPGVSVLLALECQLDRVEPGHYEFFLGDGDSPSARITLFELNHQTRQLATLLDPNPLHKIAFDSYLAELTRALSDLGFDLFSPELVRDSSGDNGDRDGTGNARKEKSRESAHWAYPQPEKRREIVDRYRNERDAGRIRNKDTWAQVNYNISGKTLYRYEKEFSEDD